MSAPSAERSTASGPRLAAGRIGALVLRYTYLIYGSWPRLIEMAYWPTVQIILWGFISQFLIAHSSYLAQAFGVLLAAVMLWDVMFRSQLGVSISFLEEIWSRNLGHLFVSPLRPYEFAIALMVMSLIRTLFGLLPAALLAMAFFGFNVFELGLSLIGFFFNLVVMGWSIALVICGLILRFGLGAESLAWAFMFGLAPLCGIYYPVSVLPDWLQPVAYALPASHVFEGMRAVVIDNVVRTDLLLNALALNVVFLAVGTVVFAIFFRVARLRGQLFQLGE